MQDHHLPDVARIALPLRVHFALMWAETFALGKAIALAYDRTATLAFTTAGNNFELAAAIATFGVTSGQALSGLVGSSSKFPAPHRSRLRPPDLLTGGLFHRLTTVRTEDFDEDAATVAFHDLARYADGCATHPIPAVAHLFLRAVLRHPHRRH